MVLFIYKQGDLDFRLQPSLEFFQRPETMGDLILLGFVHLGISVEVSE